LLMNYRTGSFNFFLNYGANFNESVINMIARRTYYNEEAKQNALSILEQPFFNKTFGKTHSLRTGMDYYISKKTTVGIALAGTALSRDNDGRNIARWMNGNGTIDSIINTTSDNFTKWKNATVNLNLRHSFNSTRELSVDVDFLRYEIRNQQQFENRRNDTTSYIESNAGTLPSDLQIVSAKSDYSQQFGELQWETGWKSSRISTDNLADYSTLHGGTWKPDLAKSNHFLYTENIHALYTNFHRKFDKWDLQSGLRYEYTAYKANQLGNAFVKDSSFVRNYHNLFPSVFLTYTADSSNSITIKAGRRIDRPPFQKLNPFLFIINKYTYQSGNPLILPQYTWNVELTHMFKQMLSTSISYNFTNDYFSQIFFEDSTAISADTSRRTIIYTDGNVGRMQNVGLTVAALLAPAKWWSLNAQANFTYKRFDGFIWNTYKASISQFNINMNNQFRFNKGWAAELSGFFIGRNQNDLQEILDPTGQVSIGLSKQILKNTGTLRFTLRDVFYTQDMEGWTYFEKVIEYFRLQRDSRVATISFSWRFGKAMKQTVKRSNGAEDEINRVGTGN
ncbi:MAG: TonB-dependent receptor, partial [Chitinophagaceae bacterium]|nr:TonB-dependent receptor [Chitinophagaceae bacterium]